jgi:hypothetical protein
LTDVEAEPIVELADREIGVKGKNLVERFYLRFLGGFILGSGY